MAQYMTVCIGRLFWFIALWYDVCQCCCWGTGQTCLPCLCVPQEGVTRHPMVWIREFSIPASAAQVGGLLVALFCFGGAPGSSLSISGGQSLWPGLSLAVCIVLSVLYCLYVSLVVALGIFSFSSCCMLSGFFFLFFSCSGCPLSFWMFSPVL